MLMSLAAAAAVSVPGSVPVSTMAVSSTMPAVFLRCFIRFSLPLPLFLMSGRQIVPFSSCDSSIISLPPAMRSCKSSMAMSAFAYVPRVWPRFSTVKRWPAA